MTNGSDISATAHRDFSAQVDRLHRVPLTWLITAGLALMIATTGRLAAKFKLRVLGPIQLVVENAGDSIPLQSTKMRALLAYLWGRVADIDITESVALHRREGRLSLRTGLSLCKAEERFGLKPERLAADTAYGAAPMLNSGRPWKD